MVSTLCTIYAIIVLGLAAYTGSVDPEGHWFKHMVICYTWPVWLPFLILTCIIIISVDLCWRVQ